MKKRLMLFINRQQDNPLIKKKYTNLSGGHWITVVKGGPLHGKHLYIDDDGVILAGKVPKEFHGKKLSELHDMDVPSEKKPDEVIKRPLPDKTPYLSKQPIHNTYSKKSPAELKAIITQAKANIKANGGNGWDKKVLTVASYYLNGGQKPDDSAFGSKKAEKAPDKQEAKSTKEQIKDSAPHKELIGAHNHYAEKTLGQLEDYQTAHINDLKQQLADGDPISDIDKKQQDIINHYLVAKGGEAKEVPTDGVDPEWQKVKDSAPHKDLEGFHQEVEDASKSQLEHGQASTLADVNDPTGVAHFDEKQKKKLDIINHYLVAKGGTAKQPDEVDPEWQKVKDSAPHQHEATLNNYYSSMDKEQLETAQSNTLESTNEDIENGDPVDTQALDMINHYLVAKGGEAKEAPKVDPKETAPHKGKYPATHKAVEDGDKLKIKEKQADLTSQMHTYIKNEQKEYYDVAKEKLEIANHYAKHHGSSAVEAPDYASNVAENNKNKQIVLDEQQKKTQAILDDFHNPSHVIQTANHEHHGKDIKDFGIDYTNSDHVHAWHTKIDHDVKGDSQSDLESRAYKMTELIKEGDHATGKTNGNEVTAKKKVMKNLGDSLMHHENFMKVAQKVTGGYKNISSLTPAQRQELAHEAVKNLISKWAYTSADHDSLAISMQLASMEEFGLGATSNTFSQESKQNAHDNYLDNPEIRDGIKAFLREQYNQTQDWFKTNGITHVPIMRGMGLKTEKSLSHVPLQQAVKTKIGLQPISSFSSSSDTAMNFTSMKGTGGGGPYKVILGAMIPVERILGCPQTGYGCMGEKEMIVLGGGKELDSVVAYRWNNNDKGNFHHSDMFKHMAELSGPDVTITGEPGKKAPKAPSKTKKTDTEYHVKTTIGYKPAINAKHVINDHGMDLFVHKVSSGYKVNEGSTGLGITMTYKTQKAAIAAAHNKLADSDTLASLKAHFANTPKHSEQMTKSLIKNAGGVLYPDQDIENADWTKTTWDLPPYGSPEFNAWAEQTGTDLEHIKKLPVYQHMLNKKNMKKSEEYPNEEYYPSDRYAYKTNAKDVHYIPVNRIKTPYQTEHALNPYKVKVNRNNIRKGIPMEPIVIGYNYDLHDGHHRLEAAKSMKHTHVPCVVGGRNERRVIAAKRRYSTVFKSISFSDGKLLIKKATAPKGNAERWVTIRGTHVKINGEGEILQGPSHMQGKNISSVIAEKTGPHKDKAGYHNDYAKAGNKYLDHHKVDAIKKSDEAKASGDKKKHSDQKARIAIIDHYKSLKDGSNWQSKMKTPYDTKAIVEARTNAKAQVPTYKRPYYHSAKRKQLRQDIIDKLYGTGAKNKNRRIDLVMGPPAAGKSTALADPLAAEHGSLIIDSDMAKEMLPEFDGGMGAGIVQEESSVIVESFGGLLDRAMENGDNIVLPLVGRDADKILKMQKDLHAAGYEVHLHLNEVPKAVSTQRAIDRFYSQKRFVDPDYVHNVVGDKPSEVYETLKKQGGFHSYEKVSNDVEKGQKPRLIEKINAGEKGTYGGGAGGGSVNGKNVLSVPKAQKDNVNASSDPVNKRIEQIKQFAQKFSNAEEFESAIKQGMGSKSPSELFAMMDNNSDGQLNSSKVKQALSEGGKHYFLTQVNPHNLKVQGQYHEQDSDKIKGVKDTFDQSKAQPVIVGSNNEVIDGRHRTLSAQKNGAKTIHAYVSAKDFYRQHVAKKSFIDNVGRLLLRK